MHCTQRAVCMHATTVVPRLMSMLTTPQATRKVVCQGSALDHSVAPTSAPAVRVCIMGKGEAIAHTQRKGHQAHTYASVPVHQTTETRFTPPLLLTAVPDKRRHPGTVLYMLHWHLLLLLWLLGLPSKCGCACIPQCLQRF